MRAGGWPLREVSGDNKQTLRQVHLKSTDLKLTARCIVKLLLLTDTAGTSKDIPVSWSFSAHSIISTSDIIHTCLNLWYIHMEKVCLTKSPFRTGKR